MKLLLGLVFYSTFFYSVYTLQCIGCYGFGGQCNNTLCPSQAFPGVKCSTTKIHYEIPEFGLNDDFVIRYIMDNESCTMLGADGPGVIYSANVGIANLFLFYSCCDTDFCNIKTMPEPDSSPNGLTCATCSSLNDTVCNSSISCVGNQNRCVNNTDTLFFGPGSNVTIKGCVSKSFCDDNLFANFTCCSGNLCNGHEDWIRLDLSLLLMLLINISIVLFQ